VCSASLMTAGLLAKYAAAGGVGACVSHAGAVPLDVVKTRVQQDPAKFAGGGVLESAKTLVKEEGWGVLSRGLANTMLGFLLHGAFKYGGFEFLKQAFLESDNAEIATFGHDHRLLTLLVAAALAETVATVALLPLEQTRIKMVSDESYADNVLEAIQRLFREDGVDGFVNSLPPIYAKMIPFSMCQLATYDVAVGASRETAAALAVAVSAVAADGDTSVAVAEMASLVSEALSSPFVAQVPASFLAATLASLASQPGDTLMSVINEGEKKETSFRETLSADARASETGVESASAFGDGSEDVLEASLGGSVVTLEKPRSVEKRSESNDETEKKKRRRAGVAETAARLGFDGLYAGWQERLAHVAAVIVIQLVVYDDIKHALIR
jgi:solute carrier family 25 phosphate transporter 3